MGHIPVRVGPLALLLTVISICMTTLGVLAFTTARADLRLAEQYADTVHIRYELEELGQSFLRDAGKALESGAEGSTIPGTVQGEDGVLTWTAEREGYRLSVGIVPKEDKGFKVTCWTVQKDWEPEDGMGGIWLGE